MRQLTVAAALGLVVAAAGLLRPERPPDPAPAADPTRPVLPAFRGPPVEIGARALTLAEPREEFFLQPQVLEDLHEVLEYRPRRLKPNFDVIWSVSRSRRIYGLRFAFVREPAETPRG
jgi:hypothetical protein